MVIFPFLNIYAQYEYRNANLKQIISDIQTNTGYYFLYRESQVSDIQLSFSSTDVNIWDELNGQLLNRQIQVEVDHLRMQVVLTSGKTPNNPVKSITGQVVDDKTGERLPFATLSWHYNNQLTGITTNNSGAFNIQSKFLPQIVEIEVSYIGYSPRKVYLNFEGRVQVDDLTIRLSPNVIKGQEIVINDRLGYNPADTLLSDMINAGRFSPLGGTNTIRALQSHPSVAPVTAINQGINIRGSSPDGFLVLLDGMSMFNQSHLFGLLDSFNSDAIQSAGYYVGITPAHIETPTGGTLNLLTRTGSRNDFEMKASLTNTSYALTLEGPLRSNSSWLVSGRSSYMNQMSWFNNNELVKWGLDIDRPRVLAIDEPDFTNEVLRIGNPTVNYIDLHTKLYYENSKGGRLTISGYLGGDETEQKAQRRTRSSGTDGEFVFLPVQTSNRWGNALMSLRYDAFILPQVYSSTLLGVSTYETSFSKDDFLYSIVTDTDENQSISLFTYPFQNQSALTEYKASQEFELSLGSLKGYTGLGARFYAGQYSESSFDRPAFNSASEALLVDTWLQTHWNPLLWLNIHVGSRVYYYSSSEDILIAPRSEIQIKPIQNVQISAGYSKSYQFLHRVSIQNATTADVWILSTNSQPPASSDQLTSGIVWHPFNWFTIRGDVYEKNFSGIRVHELSTQSLENTFTNTPWYAANSGKARGIELTTRLRVNRFSVTQTYTRSKVELQNPFLYEGTPYLADWDRTHTSNTVLETRLSQQGRLFLSWTSMSGTPNSLAIFGNANRERLDHYNRLDVSIQWAHYLKKGGVVEWSISLYNALNYDNVWYRNYTFNFDETRLIPRLRAVPVDVLDLGFQPSFTLRYSFE
jgi:hypothetical protein